MEATLDNLVNLHAISKFVLLKGDIETLGYFSEQIAKTLVKRGYDVFLFDFNKEYEDEMALTWFCEDGHTALITFNFTGLLGETIFELEEGIDFWRKRNVFCINIMVDHPFYYHDILAKIPHNYPQFCIDRIHANYMNRFFPDFESIDFLPLGGTQLQKAFKPFEERTIDILFTGNYTPPETFHKFISRIDDEYTEFYYKIIHDLIANPETPIEVAVEQHLRQEIEDLKEADVKECMKNITFIDLYVRFYFRGLVIKTLVDSGLKVHIFGKGFEKLVCEKPENLIIGGGIDSETCLTYMTDAKISLNIMPWFKDGAHDRIFNSMLNGAVCVSDGSTYIDEICKDGEDIILYSLRYVEELPNIIKGILSDKEKAQSIASCGYEKASRYHTWEERTNSLIELIKGKS